MTDTIHTTDSSPASAYGFDDPDVDLANIHASNHELSTRDAILNFYARVAKIKSLSNVQDREWLGSLSSRMVTEAIPLFEDDNTGVNYQIHLTYSWMHALHTYSYTSGNHNDVADWYGHSLFHAPDINHLDPMAMLHFVIPFGKLFVYNNGRAEWTGYELVVNAELEVWAVYALEEDGSNKWDFVESNLLPWARNDRVKQRSPNIIVARLWNSVTNIRALTFDLAKKEIQKSMIRGFGGCLYLLEISTNQIDRAITSSGPNDMFFKTSKETVNVRSSAGRQLLSAMVEDVESPIVMLEFV